MNNKPIIICASGNSIPFLNSQYYRAKCGLPLKLEQIIKGNYSIGLNYWFRYGCTTTFTSFSDWQWYQDQSEYLEKLPLIIGSHDPSLKSHKRDITHDNTILLKNSGVYNGKDSISKGCFCYDKETEVLTDQGWKYFKDLDKTEKIATLNPTTFKTEYHLPTNHIIDDYCGELIEEKSKRINLLVTPNHKMYAKIGHHKNFANYKFINANELDNKEIQYLKYFPYQDKSDIDYFYLPSITIKQNCFNHEQIHVMKDLVIPKKKIKMDYWLEFLGWYISEGCCLNDTRKGNYKIIISQKKKNNCKEIEKCLENCGFHYGIAEIKNDVNNYVIHNKQLYTYLFSCKNSYTKFIRQEFLTLSKKQLWILLHTLIKGDGHMCKDGSFSYATISKKLADNVFEIGLKLGYSPNIGLIKSGYKPGNTAYSICFSKSLSTTLPKTKRKRVLYNDKIYCVTVPNNIIYVKRRGKSCWSGNSKQLIGIWSLSLAISLGFKTIFLIGYDACEINSFTHFYQGVVNLKESTPIYIKGKLVDSREHFRGVGKHENGKYKTSTYNIKKHLNEKWFAPFQKERKEIKIYNVSPNSAIEVFEKIDYDEFYKKVKNNHIDQIEAREEIKQIIQEKLND